MRNKSPKNRNEKGASIVLVALAVSFFAYIIGNAANYNFYTTGESNLDAGTDRAVAIVATEYGRYGYDEKTLIALLDNMGLSPFDTLTQLSIYKASDDAIPGLPASGEDPLTCTQDCVRYALNSETGLHEITMDAWSHSSQDTCEETVVGITAVIDHTNAIPSPVFAGPITLSKVERTNIGVDCTELGGKQVFLNGTFDSAAFAGPITSNPLTVPFVIIKDNRNMSTDGRNFIIPENGLYDIKVSLSFDEPLPTSGVLTAEIKDNSGNTVVSNVVSFPSLDQTIQLSVTDYEFAKNDIIYVSLKYTGSGSLDLDASSEHSTYIIVTEGSQT